MNQTAKRTWPLTCGEAGRRLLAGSRLPALLRARGASFPVIVCYHGVIPDDQWRDWETSDLVKASVFREHLAFFRRCYHPIPLRQAASALADGTPLPPRPLVITFDDGYRNNLTCAAPLLREQGLPATVFLTTGFLDGTQGLWWLTVKRWLLAARQAAPSVAVEGLGTLPIASPVEARHSYSRILAFLRTAPEARRRETLARMAGQFPEASSLLGDVYAPMTWDQARAARGDLLEFGAHGVTHTILARLGPDQARWEIEHSIARMGQELSPGSVAFSYPNGQRGDFDVPVQNVLRQSGCYAACANFAGVNDSVALLYELRRVPIGGYHSAAAVELDTSGVRELARGVKKAVSTFFGPGSVTGVSPAFLGSRPTAGAAPASGDGATPKYSWGCLRPEHPQASTLEGGAGQTRGNRASDGGPSGQTGPAIRRVILAVDRMECGGKERVVMHLAHEFQDRGIEPVVVCIRDAGPFGEQLAAEGVAVRCLHSGHGLDLATIVRLARFIRRFRPDVINVHDRASLRYFAAANFLAGRRPLVLTCHGLLLASREASAAERLAARGVSVVTAVSASVAGQYAQFLHLRRPPVLISNGVHVPQVAPEAASQTRAQLAGPDEFLFVALGNVEPEKGYEDLLDACHLVRQSVPEKPFKVAVAGEVIDRDYCARLQDQARRLGLEQTVTFLGFRNDAAILYAAADAFLLPSRTEGLPMALLEAMSAHLPAVATAVGEVSGVLGTDEAGLVVPPADPPAFASAMARLLRDAELGRRLGARGRQIAQGRYSVGAMARGYLDVYGRALCGRPVNHRRLGVLMLGPHGRQVGGMVAVMDNLLHSPLASSCRLTALNTGKTTPPDRSFVAGAWAQVELLTRLVNRLICDRPDIVHIHTCSGFTFFRDLSHAALARLGGAKIVWHIHGGGFADFAARSRRTLAVVRTGLTHASAILAVGEASAAQLRPIAPGANWVVVPNGVPLPAGQGHFVAWPSWPCVPGASCPWNIGQVHGRDARGTHGRDAHATRQGQSGDVAPEAAATMGGRPRRFLFLGDLRKAKGVLDLVRAAGEARRQGSAGQVLLAGRETEQGIGPALRSLIVAEGLEGTVRLAGFLTGAAKEQALADADCLVLPSYSEALPMAILEAMACGLPVIAASVGSIPSVIEDGVEGFLIPPGDADALARRMLQLSADAELCRRLGAAARLRVERQFSLDAMAGKILDVYRDILFRGQKP